MVSGGSPAMFAAEFLGPAGLRGDAWGGLSDAPGSVLEPPGAVFGAGAADFAARSLLSDVRGSRGGEPG
jgi:hypothetical protein